MSQQQFVPRRDLSVFFYNRSMQITDIKQTGFLKLQRGRSSATAVSLTGLLLLQSV